MKKNNFLLVLVVYLLSISFINTGCSNSGNPYSGMQPHAINKTSIPDAAHPTPSTPSNSPVTDTPVPYTSPGTQGNTSVLTFSFAGDIMFDSHVKQLIEQKGEDYLISDIKPLLSKSDFVMANLETPLSSRGTKESNKQYTFRGRPENVDVLVKAGINIVSLANNHILDYGVEALEDTLQLLSGKEIKYAGAGADMDAAASPVYLSARDQTVAVLASSHVIPFVLWTAGAAKPGVASTYDPARLRSEIIKARQKADIVIVYIHWGEESKQQPLDYQRNLAHLYIDEGADIVIGSHPHVLQEIEFYKEKVIAYSLGNFIFTNLKKDTAILNIQISEKKVREVKLIPCEIINFRPTVVTDPPRAKSILNGIGTLSPGIIIDDQGVITPKK